MKIIVRGLFTFATACLAVPAFSQTSAREYNLEIERQPLEGALIEFSQQTGLQIGYFPENLSKNLFIGPLSGRYTADAAITQLLLPSGFSFERVNERTIAVTGPESTRPQRGSFLATEQKMDPPSSHSFVRVADLRWAEGPATEGNVQESGRAANARESDRKKSLGLEEVIVTAQKREERLEDVPISISVLRGDDLDRSPVKGVTEALTRVPGVAITESFQGGGAQVSVRGVGPVNSIFFGSSPIAYYLDSVPFGFVKTAMVPDANTYDLDRIEVLRGPQGTLYGASAQNGVVRILTKDADLDKIEFKARASTSGTQDGGENYRGEMAVNVPIVAGKLAARAVAGYQDLSGWIDRPNDNDANDSELLNLRFKINAQPTEKLSIGLSSWFSRSDFGAPSTGNDDGRHRGLIAEPIETDYDLFGLKVGYEFPGFSVASSTSYIDYKLDSRLDGSFNGSNILTSNFEAGVFAEEININSTHEGPWRWSLGGMYRDADDRRFQIRRNFAGGLVAPYVAPTDETNTSESVAFFGEVTRLFLDDRLEVTGGVRYFEDDVGLREDSRLNGVPVEQLIRSKQKFDALSPRLVVTWHPREQMTLYASYAEGFRSGADQSPSILVAAPNLPPTDPDNLTSYEVGAKGNVLDGRIAFDMALYYEDWQDVQQPVTVLFGGLFLPAIINGTSASGAGFDLGLTARPVHGLTLDVNFGMNDLTQDADVISGGVLLFNEGDRLNLSPEYTIGGGADYVFPLGGSGFEGQLSASANYTSRQEQRILGGTVVLAGLGDPILVAGTRFSVIFPYGWTVSLFVDNINNEQGAVVEGFTQQPDQAARLRPRTIGLQFEYRH